MYRMYESIYKKKNTTNYYADQQRWKQEYIHTNDKDV